MELFLVITILSVIALITFPLLRRPLNESVVQDAGQQLLRELAEARTGAIESGRPILFQYQPGSGNYYIGETDQRLEPNGFANALPAGQAPPKRFSSDGGFPAPNTPSSSSQTDSGRVLPVSSTYPEVRSELPGDVVFTDLREQLDERRANRFSNRPSGAETARQREQRIAEVNEENLPEAQRSSRKPETESAERLSSESLQWSSPIRFYPSGRIRPAKIPLRSAEGLAADLEILGLAGRIRLSPLRKEENPD